MSLTMRVGMRQVQGVAKWEISFIQEGECVHVGESGFWKPRPRNTAPYNVPYNGWCAV